jgi:hypothetical protein
MSHQRFYNMHTVWSEARLGIGLETAKVVQLL